jgi:CPA2 family monovalent cation:H+ antiporter-2
LKCHGVLILEFISHNFLEDLGLVLCVAAFTTVVFQAIRQPVVVGYLIAGVLVGPHTPLVYANPERIYTISELGVILLMFALGLEFSVRRLVRVGPTSGFISVLQVSLMIWLGYMVGQAMGWSTLESVFTGALLSISSTTIVAKAYEEKKVPERLRELVLGVLLTEDLIAVIELAVLTALASGNGMSARMIGLTIGRLVLFLGALLGVGMLVVPRLIRLVARFERAETLLVASIGICFAFAILADYFGYSVALGAFLAGSLVAESGQGHQVEHLIMPVRDMFAAVFFVSVGMMLDPALVAEHWIATLVLVATVIFGKILGVTVGAMLAGSGPRLSVEAGMSLAQIGEFSFIIAGLALETHAARDFLYSLAVAVSVVTTFTTPYLIRASSPVAEGFERRIPRGLAVVEAFYESAVERIRGRSASRTQVIALRWSLSVVIAGAAVIVGLIIGAEVFLPSLTFYLQNSLSVSFGTAKVLVGILTLIVCTVPSLAIYRATGWLAIALAARAVPDGAMDDEARPPGWESLVEIMHLAMMIVVTIMILAIVQPFLEPVDGAAVLVAAIVAMVIVTWRGVAETVGQMREAARLITGALVIDHTPKMPGRLHEEVIPGLGVIVPVRVEPGSPAAGRTIGDLHLPSATGAVVVAIGRDHDGLVVPNHGEILREGDVLGLAGPHHAIRAAIEKLAPPQVAEPAAAAIPELDAIQ